LWVDDHTVFFLNQLHSRNDAEVVVFDTESNASRTVGHYESANHLSASPDASHLALLSNGKLVIVNPDVSGHRSIFDLESSAETRDLVVLTTPVWSQDGRRVLLNMWGHMKRTFFEFDIESRTVRPICLDDNDYVPLSYNPGSGLVAVTRENMAEPQRMYFLETDDWKLTESFDPNENVRHLAWPEEKAIAWGSRDNLFTIHGVLLSPIRPKDGRPLPLLVLNTGGPGMVEMKFNDVGYPVAAFASIGYAVLVVNSRGRGGYGEKFKMALRDEKSRYDRPLDDVLAGVDVLVKQHIADPRRLGIMGFSYGGGLTAWAICRTNRFSAASIGDMDLDDSTVMRAFLGNADARDHYTNSYLGYRVPYDPIERRQIQRESPLNHVDDVHTPSIFEGGIAGAAARSGRPWYQATQFFHVPSELIVYPRSGHGWSEPLLILDSYRRNLAWFNYWIIGTPYPDRDKQIKYDAWKIRRAALGDPRWRDKVSVSAETSHQDE
jgi:dipeptidyl aminopeptidase/acylaminoacyl peptidase